MFFFIIKRIGVSTPIIQKVSLPIISDDECRRSWRGNVPNEGQICAGKVGADSCKGDSGGPLIMKAGLRKRNFYSV